MTFGSNYAEWSQAIGLAPHIKVTAPKIMSSYYR